MISLQTKFEVSTFTQYKDMRGSAKCRNWGGLGVMGNPGSLSVSPFNTACTTSYLTSIKSVHLSCAVFEL